MFTDWPFEPIQAEGHHRDHAIVEQVFADWNDGPLAHLPSGRFPANAAWLTLAAITANLTRAAGRSPPRPRQGPRRHHPRSLITSPPGPPGMAAGTSPFTCPKDGTTRPGG